MVVLVVFAIYLLLSNVFSSISWHLAPWQKEPISGLSYKLPIQYIYNKDFSLIVEKKIKSDIPNGNITNGKTVTSSTIDQKTNKNGLSYYHLTREECYQDHVESLDAQANVGKSLITCSDTYGSVQELYYVISGEDVYLFTTPFPTRIVYHDPSFGGYPQRISSADFDKLIDSLR